MADSLPGTHAPDSLLEFVLRHQRIKTNVCTRQTGAAGFRLDRRVVPDYNFIFAHRGRLTWVIEGMEYPLAPGTLLIVPPATPHHAFSQTRTFDFVSVHVDVILPGGQDVFELLTPPRVQMLPANCRLRQYLVGALKEWDRRVEQQAYLFQSGWAQLIVPELLLHDARQGLLKAQPVDPLVVEVLHELDRRIGVAVGLDELAAFAGYSPQHLNRLFGRVLGVTPLQHLRHLRMEKAATLLTESPLSVQAVARSVGIADPYYFSRLFHSHFGQSPAQYRTTAVGNRG